MIEKRALSKRQLEKVVKMHKSKITGKRTIEKMIASLERDGINWREYKEICQCLFCFADFDPLKNCEKAGRKSRYCSAECREMHRISKQKKQKTCSCQICESQFIPANTQCKSIKYCSHKCKSIARERFRNDPLKAEHRRIKAKEKTASKIKHCKNCGAVISGKSLRFCSDQCRAQKRRESRIASRALYFSIPENRDKVNHFKREYTKRDTVKTKINESQRSRNKRRRKEDPMFLLKERIRCRTKAAFMGGGFTKGSKTREMLGCSWEVFKAHIEAQFVKGMKWSNRHLWHLDHIVPLASAKNEDDLVKLSHFSNLRPLWADENIQKKDKIVECQPELTMIL